MTREVSADKEVLLSLEQFRLRTSLSRSSTNRLIAAGKIKTVKIGTRRMISVKALERFVAHAEQTGGVEITRRSRRA